MYVIKMAAPVERTTWEYLFAVYCDIYTR